MTILNKYKSEHEELKELLIKNLPTKIFCGNKKGNANIHEYATVIGVSKFKFINFNSKERISFMIFDIDKIGDLAARDVCPDIDSFFDYLSTKIGVEPTYILETEKGFHFGYHLKNHVYTKKKKSLKYLLDIKRSITSILGCDEIASHRLNGVWRNPLLHTCYYSKQINYELSDFKDLIQTQFKKNRMIRSVNIFVSDEDLKKGKRNLTLFKMCMIFAKGERELTQEDLLTYLTKVNTEKEVGLEIDELTEISNSVYKYWKKDSIWYGTKKIENEGIMGFEKMRNLSTDEYEAEKKYRQRQSAFRTLSIIRDNNKIDKIVENLQHSKRIYDRKKQEKNDCKVQEGIILLENEGLKVNVSSLSRITGLNRRTVMKYYKK